ncbi:MAG: penicillin-binding protein 2 [Gammaproteobacteria bacterium]|nr:penicillin-binding protein 2 [Gammaproteobacteria bacterium]
MSRVQGQVNEYRWRTYVLFLLTAAAFSSLVWRAIDLQVLRQDFLQDQGDARHLRVVAIPAHRGMILDRNGDPLAVSTPVDSVWANPREMSLDRESIEPLAAVLGLDGDELQHFLLSRKGREFVYLKRQMKPEMADRVRQLHIPGISLQREYHRYYPGGEVFAHVLGFTDIDDHGQEGLELAFDEWLTGEPGLKRVVQDGRRHVVRDVDGIRVAHPGKDLILSIDRRIQYLAYRELKAAVDKHKALSGSAVVLDANTGEVLAMVNQPSFNPNNRRNFRPQAMRNRSVTDVFEPGSTVKPFIVASALESGNYDANTPIDTTPGIYQLGVKTIRDVRNFGLLNVTSILTKSSNVGISKIALSLEADDIWSVLQRIGFGNVTASSFPGEVAGILPDPQRWGDLGKATLSYGYGLSVTPLQLAHAYSVLASKGALRPISLLRVDEPVAAQQVLTTQIAQKIVRMLETVVGPGGTAKRARIAGYRVAGKTGTMKKSIAGGYADHRYLSVFAGMVPASDPRLVMAVMINEPSVGGYYGGKVAAPVFANTLSGALRLLNINPDDLSIMQSQHAVGNGGAV